jgi:uncharacterized protein
MAWCENIVVRIASEPLARVLARYPVVAAYLFGSQATGNSTALSDMDFAVLLSPTAETPGETQAALISDLMLVLGRSDIDVVILNTAPVLLRERAISRGRLIYCSNAVARVRFETSTRREYFDTEPLREVQDRALLDRLARGA